MTKYIAYKIIKGYDNTRGEVPKGYTICHEDYIVLVLQSELKQGRYKTVCSKKQTK